MGQGPQTYATGKAFDPGHLELAAELIGQLPRGLENKLKVLEYARNFLKEFGAPDGDQAQKKAALALLLQLPTNVSEAESVLRATTAAVGVFFAEFPPGQMTA